MHYINITRWNNPFMQNYDKVMKELKQKFQIKINFKKVMHQLTNLKWVTVNSEKVYNEKINAFFDETDTILSTKINKYENIIQNLKYKKQHNLKIKNKALQKTLLTRPCAVCYENKFSSYAITRCGHTFCTTCITKCIAFQFKCPLCRGILFFKDVEFFNSTEYNFTYKYKMQQTNFITDYPINEENDIVYIPAKSSIILRNSRDHSIMINMKNITGNIDQYDFQEYLDYDQFKKLIGYMEENIKNSYDKKLSKMLELLIKVMRNRQSLTEIVVPNSIDEPIIADDAEEN